MRATRFSKRLHAALGISMMGAAAFGVSGMAEAANFPTHGYFWLDNHINPSNFEPWAEYRKCKYNQSFTCSFRVTKNQGLHYGIRHLYYFSFDQWNRQLWDEDTLIFGTAYGEDGGAKNPLYCTTGGAFFLDQMVNCSRDNNVSVRIVSNQGGTDRWRALGSGTAAFGNVGAVANEALTFNSTGGRNQIFDRNRAGHANLPIGVYKIVIPLGANQSSISNSIAHVQAVQPGSRDPRRQKRICTIQSLTKRAANNIQNAEMEVACFGRDEENEFVGMTGSTTFERKATPFNYIYEFASSGGLIRSVWSDRLVNGIYSPAHSSHSNISVQRIGTGRYTVHMPNTRSTLTNVQVSAQGTGPRWCNVLSWMSAGNGTDVKIACFKMTSAGREASDSRFFMGYYYESN